MPYVRQERRALLLPTSDIVPDNAGELNYQITELIKAYVAKKTLTYQTINDVLGACDGASKEFYRRIAVPYENTKIATNGDVYS